MVIARHLVLLLVALALMGGAGFQRVQPAGMAMPMHTAAMNCDMQMSMAHGEAEMPTAPCKAAMSDCCKQIGVGDAGLPVRLAVSSPASHAARVAYWPSASSRAGLAHSPEPLPPRTA